MKKIKTYKTLKTVFLGIGTNKGSRRENVKSALKLLSNNKEIKIIKTSKLFKNPPQEGIKSGYFLNGALEIRTSLTPLKLLKVCKNIEKKLGRELPYSKVLDLSFRKRKYFSRIIDLDILFYENRIMKSEKLTIPHLRIEKRDFVLIPLSEIAGDFTHPVLKKTVLNLRSALSNSYEHKKLSKCSV